jgi:spermidine/putrescine transport system ATP-binding protein
MDHIIDIINVGKVYDGGFALSNFSLFVRKNEFVTLLGPSGCGKTTTLRIIGGFETPTEGDILFEGRDIKNVPPHKRQVNTVFQKYALFPHMNVFENIAFGLTIRKIARKTIEEKVSNILSLVNLKGYGRRKIASLSGGQQQRVAIARALINEPKVLLLDEPLGALDLKLRKEMQFELKNMQQKLGITFIYVTHDQEEALTMSDTVVVMNDGKIQQIGKPEDIYNEPKNPFVADFIGESNIVPGVMLEDYLVKFSGAIFPCVDKGFGNNADVDVVIRPEDVDILPKDKGKLSGVVRNVTFKGVHYEMMVEAANFLWRIHSTDLSPVGLEVGLNIEPNEIHIMGRNPE